MAQAKSRRAADQLAVSIIVPVFNTRQTLEQFHQRLVPAMRSFGATWEVIFVDDGSTDGSFEMIEHIAAQNAHVRGIRLGQNFGQHSATLCGIRSARGARVVTLDDDLQHPPEEIPRLLEKLGQGAVVVYGVPEKTAQSRHRRVGSWFIRWVLKKVMGTRNAEMVSGFRAFDASISNAFAHYTGATVNIDALLAWGTDSFDAIPVRHDLRAAGASGYTLSMLIRHAWNLLTSFSLIPLQFASLAGIVFAVLGFMTLFYVVAVRLIFGSVVPGFYFIGSIVSLFSGIQLFAIGVIGEYLGRIHLQGMQKPAYVIAEEIITASDGALPSSELP